MILTGVVLIALAVFSLAYILQQTDGPGDIFIRLRCWLGVDIPVYGDGDCILGYARAEDLTTWGKLYTCYWCLGTWLTALATVAYILSTDIAWIFMPFIWFASLGLASLVRAVYDRM